MLFLRCGRLDVEGGALVLVDEQGVRVQIPAGGVACLLLEPGVTLTHAAVVLAADCGTLLLWVGEAGVRLYSAGQPGGRVPTNCSTRPGWPWRTARVCRWCGPCIAFVSGRNRLPGAAWSNCGALRARGCARCISRLAKRHGLEWKRRNYDPKDWDAADPLNQAVSVANHCLYGVCEAAVLAAGYAPAIGFIHTGKPLSFVYDIADLFKFDTVIPAAFQVASRKSDSLARDVRLRCRDMFRQQKVLSRIIPVIEEVLSAGGLAVPRLRQRPCRWPFRKQRDWAMLVIVTEAVPERLRGYPLPAGCWKCGPGMYVGSYSVRVRERLWRVVCAETGEGNAVLIWKADHESGFEFVTVGRNARRPVDWDGIRLVAYDPVPKLGTLEVDGKE